MSEEKTETVIFFREGFFYPIDIKVSDAPGRSLKEQVAVQAEGNPGTIRVENSSREILWVPQ